MVGAEVGAVRTGPDPVRPSGEAMSNEKKPMTPDAARRIQSDADRRDHNQGFKERSQRAAAKPQQPKDGDQRSRGK
jgi:hypothetical protein